MDQKQIATIERFLDHVFNPYECVDIYGRTYLDDIENILIENHGFDFGTQTFSDDMTQKWFGRMKEALGAQTMEQVIEAIRANQADISFANIRPRTDLHLESVTEWVPDFDQLLPDGTADEKHNEAQRIFSIRSVEEITGNQTSADAYELYLGADRLNPWTYLVRRELAKGTLSRGDLAVCVGNRWLGEVLYFRENIGLVNTIGLDLFTTNPDLVKVGDMHKMPFADNSVGLIFIRQALSKSYNVRIVIAEILRVLKDGGLFIIEIPGPYGWGVGRMRASDVKSAGSLINLFRGHVSRVIYRDEMKQYSTVYDQDVKRIIRVFAQIRKNRDRGMIEEKISPAMLESWVKRREKFLRAKRLFFKLPRAPRKLWRILTGTDGSPRK
ncbi:MAG TPA: methyltransferase domain-containing protein [Rhizomicrobium sp.]|nr:methyltransferase domain-containing protein [Rhizomicrobium sp.]